MLERREEGQRAVLGKGAPWLLAGFKLKPCRMLAVPLGSGTGDVPLLVITTKSKYIWTRKPCSNSFALWQEKERIVFVRL